ncbi:alpha/beta fold hydrolase [uncultured Amnibacterium sp.]|uniref:alpha/beta fold hydrolase n=1 Tax=uncultured Amnibacterium sp. TaxID=1631851 RepID=UPI0035CA8D4F
MIQPDEAERQVSPVTDLYVADHPMKRGADAWDVPVVVLVHGWACDSSDWAELVPPLQDHARVITLDLPGHGRSAEHPPYDLSSMASDVEAALDRLGVREAMLIGHSAGAEVVAQLALTRADLAARVVVVDPAYGVPDDERGQLELVAERMRVEDPRAVVADRIASIPEPAALAARHRRLALSSRPDVVVEMFEKFNLSEGNWHYESEARRVLRALRAPVLAIYRNERRGAIGRTLTSGPSDRVLVHPGGHWPHQERPQSFLRDLNEWVVSTAASPKEGSHS